MGMTITIRIERTELDPQGLKELLAMLCENAGYGVRVVSVRADQDPKPVQAGRRSDTLCPTNEKQESLWR